MGKVSINGVTIDVPDGASVSIIDDQIYVNGEKSISGFGNRLEIDLMGTLINLKVDKGSVNIKGNVNGDVNAGGSVQCSDVGGNVDAGGSVSCGNVKNSVDAGGSVNCGDIGGNVDAGGSIRRK